MFLTYGVWTGYSRSAKQFINGCKHKLHHSTGYVNNYPDILIGISDQYGVLRTSSPILPYHKHELLHHGMLSSSHSAPGLSTEYTRLCLTPNLQAQNVTLQQLSGKLRPLVDQAPLEAAENSIENNEINSSRSDRQRENGSLYNVVAWGGYEIGYHRMAR
ncbi:hypothetical protein BDV18DRAFT_134168 [Aspergillus unguis]